MTIMFHSGSLSAPARCSQPSSNTFSQKAPQLMFQGLGPAGEDSPGNPPFDLKALLAKFAPQNTLPSFSPLPAPGKAGSKSFASAPVEKDWGDLFADDLFSNPADANHMALKTETPALKAQRLRAEARNREAFRIYPLLDQIETQEIGKPADRTRLRQMVEGYLLVDRFDAIEPMLQNILQTQTLAVADLEKKFLPVYFEALGVHTSHIDAGQIGKWNFRYLPQLACELTDYSPYQRNLKTLCQATLEGRYLNYLHDPTTRVGQNNLNTQEAFRKAGLNYDKWLNYKGTVDLMKPGLESIQIRAGRMLDALQTYDPGFREPIAQFLQKEGFTLEKDQLIDNSGQNQNQRLARVIGAFPSHIDPPAGQATAGASAYKTRDPGALAMMSLRPRLHGMPTELIYAGEAKNRLLDTLSDLAKNPQPEGITIRRWDREPGKDLFQANDTGSCIALGYGRGEGSVDVMENTFVQLAEFYNHEQKQVTGKALFFWCRDMDRDGEPVLVINTFEGRKSACEDDPSARDALVEYAQGMAKEVAGGKDVRIYTAHHMWNPLYKGQATEKLVNLYPIGDSASGQYYFDTFGSNWVRVNQVHRNVPIIELVPQPIQQ